MERIAEFSTALFGAWSLQSSSLWTSENPAAGHCGVTALVANDLFDGDICKTKYGDIWHFYNVINGQRQDFTESQFKKQLHYSNVPSSREEAFCDTNVKQYNHLKRAVFDILNVTFKADDGGALFEGH